MAALRAQDTPNQNHCPSHLRSSLTLISYISTSVTTHALPVYTCMHSFFELLKDVTSSEHLIYAAALVDGCRVCPGARRPAARARLVDPRGGRRGEALLAGNWRHQEDAHDLSSGRRYRHLLLSSLRVPFGSPQAQRSGESVLFIYLLILLLLTLPLHLSIVLGR